MSCLHLFMENKSLSIHYQEFNSLSELAPEEKKLLELAKEAALKAYSPYSHFYVGAAVLLDNGIIVTGNNQENAAYPSGICAERVALFSASSQYPGIPVTAIAVTAKADYAQLHGAVPPCGACRQVMAEYETLYEVKMRIIFSNGQGKGIKMYGVESLLPFMFSKKDLSK